MSRLDRMENAARVLSAEVEQLQKRVDKLDPPCVPDCGNVSIHRGVACTRHSGHLGPHRAGAEEWYTYLPDPPLLPPQPLVPCHARRADEATLYCILGKGHLGVHSDGFGRSWSNLPTVSVAMPCANECQLITDGQTPVYARCKSLDGHEGPHETSFYIYGVMTELRWR